MPASSAWPRMATCTKALCTRATCKTSWDRSALITDTGAAPALWLELQLTRASNSPFRWVCLSHSHDDLRATDRAAMDSIDTSHRPQDRDNYAWIRDAEKNAMVVGTEARILYADPATRVRIALAFNKLVRDKKIGPVMVSRDHHDTGGTDSPFRETANIYDGSSVMADMAHQVRLSTKMAARSSYSPSLPLPRTVLGWQCVARHDDLRAEQWRRRRNRQM